MPKALNSRAVYLAIGFYLVLTAAFPFSPRFCVEAASRANPPSFHQNDSEEPPRSADVLLEAGNTAYVAGDLANAEKNWIEVRNSAHRSGAWPKAVYNLGILEMSRANYPKAIGYFNEVLQSSPNDKEPGGNIMSTYRNYSNRSAQQISMCYEKMADYREALHFTLLAKNRYPYLSWCGTYLEAENLALNRRIAYLSMRVYAVPLLGVAFMTLTVFSWKKLRIN
jgi:tetratricopeptide (TPR) repeat protein